MVIVAAILLALIIYFGEQKLYDYFCYRDMWVNIRFKEAALNVGDTGELEEIIINDKRMNIPVFEIKFKTSRALEFSDAANSTISDNYYRHDIFSLKGKQKVRRTMKFRATKRGHYSIDEFDLISKDYFMNKSYYITGRNETDVLVYPKKIDVNDFVQYFRRSMGEQIARKLTEEDPLVFRGIREYAFGDSMRRVNWKSTASSGKLLVNTYETTNAENVCIIFDTKTLTVFDGDELQEASASIVSSVSQEFIYNGVPVSLFSNAVVNEDYIHIFSDNSVSNMTELDEALARLEFDSTDMSLQEVLSEAVISGNRNTVYIVVSVQKRDMLYELLAGYKERGYDIFGILPFNTREGKNLMPLVKNDEELIDERYDELVYPWRID